MNFKSLGFMVPFGRKLGLMTPLYVPLLQISTLIESELYFWLMKIFYAANDTVVLFLFMNYIKCDYLEAHRLLVELC
jgi:hypothetical protein